MSLVYSDAWQEHYLYLLGLLQTAAVSGGALDFTGDGLANVTTVEEVVPVEGTMLPAVGVQFVRSSEKWIAQFQTLQTSTFEINLIFERFFDPSEMLAARATKRLAEKMWNDQAGNGLGPLLRQDPTLDGTANDSWFSDVQIITGRSATDESQTSGLIVATFITTAELRVQS